MAKPNYSFEKRKRELAKKKKKEEKRLRKAEEAGSTESPDSETTPESGVAAPLLDDT